MYILRFSPVHGMGYAIIADRYWDELLLNLRKDIVITAASFRQYTD